MRAACWWMTSLLMLAGCSRTTDVVPVAEPSQASVRSSEGDSSPTAAGLPADAEPAMPAAPEDANGDPSTSRPAANLQSEETGIEVVALRLSAGGYMLDFRYRVADPEKAARFLDRSVRPYLIDEATDARLYVPAPPKVGPLRQVPAQSDPERTYFILFANPRQFVKPGNRVTVVSGDRRIEHVMVE